MVVGNLSLSLTLMTYKNILYVIKVNEYFNYLHIQNILPFIFLNIISTVNTNVIFTYNHFSSTCVQFTVQLISWLILIHILLKAESKLIEWVTTICVFSNEGDKLDYNWLLVEMWLLVSMSQRSKQQQRMAVSMTPGLHKDSTALLRDQNVILQ